jgi:triacylglycerol lipase
MALADVTALGGTAAVPAMARWLGRVAGALTAPLVDEVHTLAQRAACDVRGVPLVGGRGLPVLIVGGLASTPQALAPLHDWLRRSDCLPVVTHIRYGLDCSERTADRVSVAMRDLAESTGRRCAIVAHSRGGQVARAVAVRHPELTAGLVTLGSPLNRPMAIHPLLRMEVAALGLAGSLGVPGLLSGGCLWGSCCRDFRADLAAPWPDGVPFLSVFSRFDRLVDWRSSLDPAARHREVSTSHGGLLFVPEVLRVLAEEVRLLADRTDPVPARAA